MGLLIDSSVFIAVERSGESPGALLEKLGDQGSAIAAITASELLHGVHRAESALRRGYRERFVETILKAVPVLAFTLEVARTHAQIWADLESRGEIIGAHDLLIASTALTHDLTVATKNVRHFERVASLQIATW